ncbi:thioredoxin-dependent thiol peroxidase [Bartonella sp. W8097]|uniref:thioredoxin-dependent thiol peroxidase n=1 Tax=Bartonella apihabitans TaxID=2750929 RepID=UPI0018DE198C|nr:thioredoxin-dependent thiol peroxidase [Bartonella apihabitans]MBI0021195.1 thioredoxin-dependent thiol peroxidase [Bartonella apihabitans]
MAGLQKGDIAPDFNLPRDSGKTQTLSELRGHPVVLYFYPKDDTSGCTLEAHDFTELRPEFDKIGVTIIGMSPDKAEKHDKFISKHDLQLILVSDEEKTTLQKYGVWVEKSMYGRKYMGVERSTFLIDKNAKIAEIWRKVKVPGHAKTVLEKATTIA